jgi:hypothetical protein
LRHATHVLILIAGWLAQPVLAQMGGFGGLGGFGGPSARNTNPQQQMGAPYGFMPWLGVSGSYSNRVALTPDQSGPDSSLWSASAIGGLAVGKALEHGELSANVLGSYQRQFNQKELDGGSGVASLGYSQSLTQRLTFSTSQLGGTSLGGFGYGGGLGGFGGFSGVGMVGNYSMGPNGNGFGTPLQNGIVDNELLLNRVNFYNGTAGLSYAASMRWSLMGGVGAAVVRRQAEGLIDMNAGNAYAGAMYALDEHSSLGFMYSYSMFQYPGYFGNNKVQMGGVSYLRTLTRNTGLGLFVSGYNFRSKFLGSVTLDPQVAELLGVDTELVVTPISKWLGGGGVQLSHSIKNFGATIAFTRTIVPTNGLLLTSAQNAVTGNLSYSRPRYSFGAMGAYYRARDLYRTDINSNNTLSLAFFSYRLYKVMSFTSSAGYQWVGAGVNNSSGRRSIATVGIAWSPSEHSFGF